MQTIRVLERTGNDGDLHLRIPLGTPDAEFEVLVVVQPKPTPAGEMSSEKSGWPAGYFDLAGSISDETFDRPPQGVLPRPINLE